MSCVYDREILEEIILNDLTKVTLPKSVSNQLGNVSVPSGMLRVLRRRDTKR